MNIVIVHPAKQHSLTTVNALVLKGHNVTLITSLYNKPYSITHLLHKLKTFKTKTFQYTNINIIDDNVKLFCELSTYFLIFLRKIIRSKNIIKYFQQKIIASFSKRSARYIQKKKFDILISYDLNSYALYNRLKKYNSSIIKVLDMSAPAYKFMVEQYKRAKIEKYLTNDKNVTDMIKISQMEILSADYYLVASNFTLQSLIFSEINNNRIFTAVYPPNTHTKFFLRNNSDVLKTTNNALLTCSIIGNVSAEKGVEMFLNLIVKEQIKININLIGDFSTNSHIYAKYKELFKFTGYLDKKRVSDYVLNSDFIVFPSFADGFGFSGVEGLYLGVPLLVSNNAGVSDLIIDGLNGYRFNPFDYNDIKIKLLKMMDAIINNQFNRIDIINSLKEFNLQSYSDKISKILTNIFELERGKKA